METSGCPYCGAQRPAGRAHYDCGSPVQPDALQRPAQSKGCLRQQLARYTGELTQDEWSSVAAMLRGRGIDPTQIRDVDQALRVVRGGR